jgi:hypothetical protein
MKKWLIGGGILGALVVALLVGGLVKGALAQSGTPPAPSQATITPEEAKDAALAANPGTAVVQVDLDDEGDAPVYEVELDSGLDVKVDANSGAVLGTEQGDADGPEGAQEELNQGNEANERANDLDSVQNGAQEELENQADNAQEVPQAENTPEQ